MTGSSQIISDTARVCLASRHRSQLAVASLFGALGFGYGTWTSRLPAIKADLGLDTSQVSVVLLSAALGGLFSFPVTATALHKLGSRGASLLSGCPLAAALVLLGLVPTWALACVAMGAFGVLASVMDVAMNAQGVEVERATTQPVMSRLHAMFSLGTMGGALFASAITTLTSSVPLHFVVAATIMLAAVLLPRAGLVADARPLDGGKRAFALPRGAALLIGAMAFLGMIAEGSMVDWSRCTSRNGRARRSRSRRWASPACRARCWWDAGSAIARACAGVRAGCCSAGRCWPVPAWSPRW